LVLPVLIVVVLIRRVVLVDTCTNSCMMMLLKSLLSSFLQSNEQLKEVTLINRNNQNNVKDKDTWSDRFSTPDIKAVDEKGRHCNIEMEVNDYVHYNKLMLYECSELYKN
jgi:hypothetical protein